MLLRIFNFLNLIKCSNQNIYPLKLLYLNFFSTAKYVKSEKLCGNIMQPNLKTDLFLNLNGKIKSYTNFAKIPVPY